ncbi:MAG: protein-disulfide reductase DsbD [Oceanospirillaceae bacterium]|jgi:thioredoxin:protein disulfide reductase|nr:protein-disulfide reductase DsbD [Oceanospirillaceae bacterium]MBT4442339.1 protein-disulfide reductase DsbD [Oceanospirillaceae bacterium]MBT7330728.1 protein-disulfide reductase DsbD [Oceanospirillaceae bacterium]
MQISWVHSGLRHGVQVVALLLLMTTNANAALFNSPQHPLPAADAFPLTVEQHGHKIDIIWNTAPDYYLYQDKLAFTTSNNHPLTDLSLSPAKVKQDPTFGTTNVYYGQLHLTGLLPLTTEPATTLRVHYQGCWDGGVCYPPQTMEFDLTPVIAAQPVAAQAPSLWAQSSGTNANWFIMQLEGSSVGGLLIVFFLAGLALAFTPCVLPMVPILSSIIVGLNPKPSACKSFALSAAYVLAMALTYSLAGLVAGLSGANVQIALQQPWVIGVIASLFVVFAGAMFGWFNVQMPTLLQLKINQLTQRRAGGQFVSVAIMGALSALVVGPCVAAPLAGALLFIAQTGDATLGGFALFVMGLGMGLPLLLVGTSAGRFIPQTGAWMQRIKTGFGFLMLYMAIWMSDRVWSQWSLWLVAVVTLVLALSLLLNSRWKPALASLQGIVFAYFAGVLLAMYAITLLVGLLLGHASLLAPLQGLTQQPSQSLNQPMSITKVTASAVPLLLNKAQTDDQVVMLDFYADWCISCVELDVFVFTNAGVQAALSDVAVIKVDVTANEPEAVALMRSLQLVGPPALVFYSASGELLLQHTVVGVPETEDLVRLIERVKGY